MSDLTLRTATTRDVVSVNRTAILDALQQEGPLSRKQIAQVTGLGTATVDRLCAALIAERRIAVHGQQPSSGGRPTQLLRYDGTSHTVAALEVGARGARGRLVDLDGKIVDELLSTNLSVPFTPLDALIGVVDELRTRADALNSPCLAIGVSVPGIVHRGRVMNTTELGWHEVPLAAMLESRSGLPTIVENDANAIAFGEWSCGAGIGSQSLAALVVGVGVGAGVVTAGRLHHGANSAAGEVGFLLADTTAMSRYFTDQGDLEGRIESLAQPPRSAGADDRSTAIANLIARTDRVSEPADVTGELFDLIAFSCAAISVLFDPETVVLSGHLALPDRAAIDQIERRLIGRIPFVPRFATGTLGADAAIVGVAELAAREARGATYLA